MIYSENRFPLFGIMLLRLCQNATQARVLLMFGTRFEQIAPESVILRRTHLFTARYRCGLKTAHNMQHGRNWPQPAADDKG
jgi:hypothetical protein